MLIRDNRISKSSGSKNMVQLICLNLFSELTVNKAKRSDSQRKHKPKIRLAGEPLALSLLAGVQFGNCW